MKILFKISILACILPSYFLGTAFGEAIQGNITEFNRSKKNELDLLNNPKLKKIVDGCEESGAQDLSTCVWEKVKDDEKLITIVENKLKIGKQEANYKKFESLEVYKQDREKNKVLEEMEEFFNQKLRQSLHGVKIVNGKEVGPETTVVTHGVYYELAKSQIGKSIIMAISSYCIEADSDHQFRVLNNQDERLNIKNKNLANLKTGSIVGNKSEKSIKAYDDWAICYQALPKICYQSKSISDDLSKNLAKSRDIYSGDNAWEPKDESDSDIAEDTENKLTHLEYTRMRSCEVVNFMEKSRQELKALEGIGKRLKVLNEDNKGTLLELKLRAQDGTEKGVKLYNREEKDKGIDDILITTSNDFNKAHKEGVKKELKEFDKCGSIDENTKEFSGADNKACERYLKSSKKEVDRYISESNVKAKVHGLHIDEYTKEKKGIEDILKEQGYTDKDIKKMLSSSNDLIKEQITERYKNKSKSIIDSLKVQGQKTTRKDNKKVIFTDTDDTDNLKAIHNDLTKSTKDFTQLVHFNNIVSGYLGISVEGSDKTSKNINSLKREISGISDDIATNAEKKILKTAIKDSEILKSENSSGREGVAAEIDVSNVNTLLYYELKDEVP